MQRDGHVGLGFGLYAPVAFVLVRSGQFRAFGLGLLAIALWSVAPDVDVPLPIPHRGPTHSVLAAGAAGVITAALATALASVGVAGVGVAAPGSPSGIHPTPAAFGFFVGAAGVVGHLLGDVVTPKGIRPWWPLSTRAYTFELVSARNRRANRVLSAVGSGLLVGAAVAATAL